MHSSSQTSRHMEGEAAFWSLPTEVLLSALSTNQAGLPTREARTRQKRVGSNTVTYGQHATALWIFLGQFRSPLVLILIFAAIVSGFVGEGSEAVIIGIIVLASCVLSFTQEYNASRVMDTLKGKFAHKARALRDGLECDVLAEDIVPGDVIRLSAGNLIPADCVLLESREFNVIESALTGEAFPVLKKPGLSAPGSTLAQRCNMVFAGTSVRSGTATAVVVNTGADTEFAAIAKTLARQSPETEFVRGIRHFGYLMSEIMLVIVLLVFFANLLLHRPIIDSLLFSLALAVGLTPELLPAIISVTLSQGARSMAADGVIVRRLDAIENLGSMDILCTDKTGTLTEGTIVLKGCFNLEGTEDHILREWALINSILQQGITNPLDEGIIASKTHNDDLSDFRKIDEIPYDFTRRRLSVIVRGRRNREDLLICKGAVSNVLEACSSVLRQSETIPLDQGYIQLIDERVKNWSEQGFRVLGLAIRRFERRDHYWREDELKLTFVGFLVFFDPPKPDIARTLTELSTRGIRIKMISGDNRYVALHLAESVGLDHRDVLTGSELTTLTKEALGARVARTDIFAEIDPNQKEHIISALRRRGHVVGYLGDGINDAPALHEADIGISVSSAVDVAREAADMILLKRDLDVLLKGVDNGRRTFANTMKYIAITTSANFGNMVSMALASLALPFLPLLAPQILLNNFLSDIPSLAIARDNVDPKQVLKPLRWDIHYVRRFMLTFGLVSSVFDFLTFGFLLFIIGATAQIFQTGWFVESLITQLTIILVVRTREAAWKSYPNRLLLWLTLAICILTVTIPYSPGASTFGFVPLSFTIMGGLAVISVTYLIVSELVKYRFFAGAPAKDKRREKTTVSERLPH